jgi:hypothetical protein
LLCSPRGGGEGVNAGHLTQLGTVLFQRIHADPLSVDYVGSGPDEAIVVSRVDDDVALREFVELQYPKASASLTGAEVLGWLLDDLGEQRKLLRGAILSYAVPADARHRSESGEIVAVGRVGTLHRRGVDGARTQVHVGGFRDMLNYSSGPGGHYAAGERGTVCDAIGFDNPATYVFIGWKKKERVPVLRSAGGAKENVEIGSVPYGCNQLLTAVSTDDLVFSQCFDGSWLASRDGGVTWSQDFSRTVRADAIPEAFKVSIEPDNADSR